MECFVLEGKLTTDRSRLARGLVRPLMIGNVSLLIEGYQGAVAAEQILDTGRSTPGISYRGTPDMLEPMKFERNEAMKLHSIYKRS